MTDFLPFWHFFEKLENELGYKRSMDTYQVFLNAVLQPYLTCDEEWRQFRIFCKVLLLKNVQDESRFNQLLTEAIQTEQDIWRKSNETSRPELPSETGPDVGKRQIDTGQTEETDKDQKKAEAGATSELADEPPNDQLVEEPSSTLYLQTPDFDTWAIDLETPRLDGKRPAGPLPKVASFLLTDEYFNITRRQMIKAWQTLRYREKGKISDTIDIASTVKQIGREGLFTIPQYVADQQNREDALLIFADYRGSMAPFHELSDRLIQMAKSAGGHPKAAVFYFQNFPLGYVYRHSNLSGAVKLKEALFKANRNFTIAVVISDAGASKGGDNSTRIQMRLRMTKPFLEALSKACAHIVWLNPLPAHRWKDNAAGATGLATGQQNGQELDRPIKDLVTMMVPLLDNSQQNFQDVFLSMFKR